MIFYRFRGAGGVAVGQEGWIDRGEGLKGLVACFAQDDDLEAAHQGGGVRALAARRASIKLHVENISYLIIIIL